MNDKNFAKMIIKIVINIWESTPLQNFSQLSELQIFGPNLSKKKKNELEELEKTIFKIVISL